MKMCIRDRTKYVVPVYGAGLWGAIWGYIALNEDKDTVYGTYFSHASEKKENLPVGCRAKDAWKNRKKLWLFCLPFGKKKKI